MNRALLLLSVIIVTSCINSSKISKYEIVDPIDEKFHAIIKIKNSNRGYCSAFVVDDQTALTAGHCLTLTRAFKEQGLKDKLNGLQKTLNKAKNTLSLFLTQCTSPSQCQLIKMQFAANVDYIKKQIDYLKSIDIDQLTVYNHKGVDTKIVAQAEYKSIKRDYGIIKGDFKKFNKLKLKKGFDTKAEDLLKACGFPGGKDPAVCVDFEAIGPIGLMYEGRSMFIRGISGGPIIDSNNEVIGIASSVNEETKTANIEPILGVLNIE